MTKELKIPSIRSFKTWTSPNLPLIPLASVKPYAYLSWLGRKRRFINEILHGHLDLNLEGYTGSRVVDTVFELAEIYQERYKK